MNRRDSFKIIGLGTISGSLLIEACQSKPKESENLPLENASDADRQAIEVEKDRKLHEQRFFTNHETATIAVLCDMILPADDRSGSASDAGVTEFIEFIVKDMPDHQVPVRGGLRWLDMQCLSRFNKSFLDCEVAERTEIVDAIAYPALAKPEMKQGVAFFDRMRNLTASGFFTSKMGMDDLGYAGNKPHIWKGVPDEIIKQYGLEDMAKAFE